MIFIFFTGGKSVIREADKDYGQPGKMKYFLTSVKAMMSLQNCLCLKKKHNYPGNLDPNFKDDTVDQVSTYEYVDEPVTTTNPDRAGLIVTPPFYLTFSSSS